MFHCVQIVVLQVLFVLIYRVVLTIILRQYNQISIPLAPIEARDTLVIEQYWELILPQDYFLPLSNPWNLLDSFLSISTDHKILTFFLWFIFSVSIANAESDCAFESGSVLVWVFVCVSCPNSKLVNSKNEISEKISLLLLFMSILLRC